MNATLGEIGKTLADIVRGELGTVLRYQYQTVEVDPSNEQQMDQVLTEYAAAGWRLHSVVPTYVMRWPRSPDQEGHEDIHINVARMLWERVRE